MNVATKLETEKILDCGKAWTDVLDYKLETPVPFHMRRIQGFLGNVYGEKINASDIDLGTFLILLKHARADVKFEDYENTTREQLKLSQQQVGLNCKGKVIAIRSNRYTFNFSLTILDERYEENGKKSWLGNGCPRTFTLTDPLGNLMNNWKSFQVIGMSKDFESYISNLVDQSKIDMTRFVNKQLAAAFYTEYYMNMKLLLQRIKEEKRYLNGLIKKHYPLCTTKQEESGNEETTTEVVKESKENTESIMVNCFESFISNYKDHEFKFTYIDESKLNSDAIVGVCRFLLKDLNNVDSDYRFMCRMIELAFTQVNPYNAETNPMDFTIDKRYDCRWNEQKIKFPRSRIEWMELIMFRNYSILCRYYPKSIQRKIRN